MTLKPILTLGSTEVSVSKDSTLITGDELFTLGDIGSGELVKGVIIQMTPPGYWHGILENRFGKRLSIFVDQHDLGYVMVGEAGVYTGRNPDTVRGMDVAFISHKRMAQVKSKSYLDVAPELIVEVLSPGDRWDDVNDKLSEYFAVGVQVVWVADPKQQQLHIYHSLTDVEILTVDDELAGGDLLPNFRVPVAELFKTS